MTPVSILPSFATLNPKDHAPFDNVNSPEQPPVAQ